MVPIRSARIHQFERDSLIFCQPFPVPRKLTVLQIRVWKEQPEQVCPADFGFQNPELLAMEAL